MPLVDWYVKLCIFLSVVGIGLGWWTENERFLDFGFGVLSAIPIVIGLRLLFRWWIKRKIRKLYE